MKVETVKCDSCGAIKKEVNHWWKIAIPVEGDKLAIYSHHSFGILQRNPPTPFLDLCGRSCVIAKVSEFLGTATAATEKKSEN